ncbi:MAG: histidine kinase [Gammaproteobacteria bacterium]|nr:histidine kinase [Gammaproteobacteria bacterium]
MASGPQSFLPDLCTNHAVFTLVLIAELLAVVLVLAGVPSTQQFWVDLGLVSLFIQITVLCTAAILCGLRSRFARLPVQTVTLIAYGLTQLLTLLCYLSALRLYEFDSFKTILDDPSTRLTALRNFAISSIVSLAALRYFYVQHQWQRNVRAELQTRLQALRARIRPHFLFNSLNTIAGLIGEQPDQAEQAVVDLAGLFRSSLEEKDTVSLAEELDITRHYLRLEGLRLGERLRVDWHLPSDLPLNRPIPALSLQPLVENAVYHGIEPLTEGGVVAIRIERQGDALWFEITNPCSPTRTRRHEQGNRMAQDNIRQRLQLAYGQSGLFTIQQTDDRYQVRCCIPGGTRS